VFAAAFAADGMTIVTSSGDHTARVWQFGRSLSRPAETTSQQKPKSSPVVGRRATAAPGPTIESVAYSPDRRIVLTGDRSGLARLWDAATGRPLAVPLRHPHDRIPAVAFGRPLTVPLRHPHDRIRAVAFSPDGRLFATGSHGPVEGGAARIWETATGRPRSPWLPHPSWVSALAFSPDGTLLATGSYDFRVTLWDVATGRPRGAPLRQNDIVLSLAFSPDGRTLAAGTAHDWRRDPQAQLWDVAAGQPRGEPMRHQHWVNLLLFSPDGRTLLTGARDGIARLWDATTGKPLSPPLPHPWECTAAAFSPDGTTVLTGSMDGTARLWRVPDGTPLGLPMLHPAMVPSVAFSPDGRTAAVASADGSAWLWDVATNIPLGPPAVQNAKLRSVAFASDGRAFLTTGDDGTTRAWPVPAPLEGDGESLTLRLQVRTGLEMDATGQAVLPLTVADWEQRRQRLAALDGSPDGALGPGVDEAAWHDARARDAEQDGDLFAARWHLDRLIARDPTDWLLYARRGRVHSTQGRFDLALADYRNAAAHGSPPMLRDWFAHRVVDCGLSGQKGAAAWYAFHLLGGF
jgi:WD40 repeat protein